MRRHTKEDFKTKKKTMTQKGRKDHSVLTDMRNSHYRYIFDLFCHRLDYVNKNVTRHAASKKYRRSVSAPLVVGKELYAGTFINNAASLYIF